ncbi:hypothetical protein BDW75DRAFT_210014 [Aspergillus navahoensis]
MPHPRQSPGKTSHYHVCESSAPTGRVSATRGQPLDGLKKTSPSVILSAMPPCLS